MRADGRTVGRQSDCRLTADAIVVAARADGTVDLEFAPRPPCAACAGTCLWKRLRAMRLDNLPVEAKLRPGAAVSVALEARGLFRSALASYGLPLVAILTGAAAGAALTGSDAGTLAGALLALLILALALAPLRRRLERQLLASLVVREKR